MYARTGYLMSGRNRLTKKGKILELVSECVNGKRLDVLTKDEFTLQRPCFKGCVYTFLLNKCFKFF